MIVRIYETTQAGSRKAGRFRLCGAAIAVEPTTPEDRQLLETILAEPILIETAGVPAYIHATQEQQRFLENLCREYSGSYLRASRLE